MITSRLSLVLITAIAAHNLYGMTAELNSLKTEENYFGNTTKKGVRLTPETLAGQVPELPESDKAVIAEWLGVDKNRALMEQLCSFEGFPNWEQKKAKDRERLEQAGYKHLARSNYSAVMGEQEPLSRWRFIVTAAGHRLFNLLSSANRIEGELWGSKEYFNKSVAEVVKARQEAGKNPEGPTYQSASRAAAALILDRCKQDQGLTRMVVPRMAIVNLPGKSGVADDSCFVVQEYYPDIKKIEKGSLEADALPDETVRQLFKASVGGGCWDWNNNLFVSHDGNQFYAIDTEQPNNSNPDVFHGNNIVKFWHNVQCGLQQLLEFFTSPEKKKLIAQCFKEHPEIQKAVNEGHLKNISATIEELNKSLAAKKEQETK